MKRAIFVRSKMTIMAELEKRAREKGIYKVTLWGSFANFLLVIFKFLAGIAGHSAANDGRCRTFSFRFRNGCGGHTVCSYFQ